MSARLVYKNSTPEAMAWAKDYQTRSRQVQDDRYQWMEALYNAHDVPDIDDQQTRGAFVQGERFAGIAWPTDIPLPKGWYRPVHDPELIRPRSGSKAHKEMPRFNYPIMRVELREHTGMKSHVFVGLRMYRPGIRLEDDAVWVSWGTRDVEDELSDVARRGWVRVPLTEYIERFGEDAL